MNSDNLKTKVDKNVFDRIAKFLGYQKSKKTSGGEKNNSYIPSAADVMGIKDFTDFFNSKQEFETLEEKRRQSYQTFSRMDESMSEISMSLDTYADEMFSSGLLDDPFEFFINGVDEEDVEKLHKILDRNNIKSNARADGRNLCKFGDLGYKIYLPKEGEEIEKMILLPFTPDCWKVEVLDDVTLIPIKYYLNPTNSNSYLKEEELNIFEFIQFSVSDNEFKPYGRSLLDNVVIPADQLKTLESLLALSRASKIERVIIKVPTDETNPTASLQKLSQIKNQIKNTIFKDQSNDSKSINKVPSLLDMMYIPKDGFEIDKLQSSIDLSSTEDVEYFRDKLILALRLPKGFLNTSDDPTFTLNKDGRLAAMDLKFARALFPYQKAYVDGLQKMCFIIMYHILRSSGKSYNLNDVKIEVKLKKPPQVALEMMEVFKGIGEAAREIITSYKEAMGESEDIKITRDGYKKLLIKLGMTKDVASLFTLDDFSNTNNENNNNTKGWISESLIKSDEKNNFLLVRTIENLDRKKEKEIIFDEDE